MKEKNINNCLQEFLKIKKLCGLSVKTLEDYESFVSIFTSWLNDKNIYSLTDDILLEYVSFLTNRHLSKATRATYIRHAKVFLNWLCEEYQLNLKVNRMPVPKTPKKNPYMYNRDEISLIFQTIYGEGQWIDLRNCAIVSLMLDSGFRRNEICMLTHKDINYMDKVINVFGKGEKERFVPLGNVTSTFMKEYHSRCPFSSDYFFVNKSGEPITSNSIKLFMFKYSKQLPFEFSSHRLRHNFGTNFLVDMYYTKGCMDIYALMSVMGHEQIKTTERYLHVANQIIYTRSHISHIDSIHGITARTLNQNHA